MAQLTRNTTINLKIDNFTLQINRNFYTIVNTMHTKLTEIRVSFVVQMHSLNDAGGNGNSTRSVSDESVKAGRIVPNRTSENLHVSASLVAVPQIPVLISTCLSN